MASCFHLVYSFAGNPERLVTVCAECECLTADVECGSLCQGTTQTSLLAKPSHVGHFHVLVT